MNGDPPAPDVLQLRPIGIIRTPFREAAGAPIQPSRSRGARGTVTVFEEYREALRDLEGFDRIWLLYWFHLAPAARLRVTPFLDTAERGLFATRAPCRPTRIGLSAVELLRIEGAVLEVSGVDMLDETPLLDIKPYVPEFDSYPEAKSGWLEGAASERRLADDRFSKERPEGEP
ncbi:MAG: tRNA (N6-threonylcarbamoyladenosine(37)-N6)-methyltransferase TrmO [Acidobacteria bacterium]|nr:tRNA (N6-threonylcarbamoyladenosine(37)-N6)-methyltransferase TrmO [Acidobacteriota bacterium]